MAAAAIAKKSKRLYLFMGVGALLIIAAALVVVFVVLKAGSGGPGAAVKKYLEAVDNGKVTEAWDYLSGSELSTGNRTREQYEEWVKNLKQTITNLNVESEEVSGNSAVVRVEVTTKDGENSYTGYNLLKAGDEWKIDSFYDYKAGDAVDALLSSINEGNAEATWELFSNDSGEKQLMTKDELFSNYLEDKKDLLKSWTIVGTTFDDNYVNVSVIERFTDGTISDVEIQLVKENGEWKLPGLIGDPGGNRFISQNQIAGAGQTNVNIESVTGWKRITITMSIQNPGFFGHVQPSRSYLVDSNGVKYNVDTFADFEYSYLIGQSGKGSLTFTVNEKSDHYILYLGACFEFGQEVPAQVDFVIRGPQNPGDVS